MVISYTESYRDLQQSYRDLQQGYRTRNFELECSISAPRSVASVPCQRSGSTFLDYKVGTRPQQRGFQVRKQSCTLSNFPVNLGNFLYLLYNGTGMI